MEMLKLIVDSRILIFEELFIQLIHFHAPNQNFGILNRYIYIYIFLFYFIWCQGSTCLDNLLFIPEESKCCHIFSLSVIKVFVF